MEGPRRDEPLGPQPTRGQTSPTAQEPGAAIDTAPPVIRDWRVGDAALQTLVARGLAGDTGQTRVLFDNPRRRVLRLRTEDRDLLLKQFRLGSGRHAGRERWKALIGYGPAERELRALQGLHAAGVPVPLPRGLARLEGGDRLLVMDFVPGRPLGEVLREDGVRRRRDRLAALGAAVAALHRAGFAHGDLHQGNILVAGPALHLLDLQHSRPQASAAARIRDLAELDHSLQTTLAIGDRMRLRAAALGVRRPFDADARMALRAVGDAVDARARRYGHSRTRRALRAGRLSARFAMGAERGLRRRELPEADARRVFEAHRAALAAGDARVLKHDDRSRITAVQVGEHALIVKEVLPRGIGRRVADLWRGSPARRAWRAGHGLLARGVGAARPLVFLEGRRWGLPATSAVVLEDLRPARDALHAAPEDPEVVTEVLLKLVLGLHRRGIDHGDLKAAHVFIGEPTRSGARSARLIDLEGVRFPDRLSDAQRIEALAQLNGSLPDTLPADLRREAFGIYASRLPFASGSADALRRVVARSIERRHHWKGEDCPLAAATPATGGERG